jgi:hypothetical protein
MHSWIRSILTFFAVGGVAVTGCNPQQQQPQQPKETTPPAATMDVVLNVPGMF